MVNKDDIITALKSVLDPEINIDIYTLGLIYNLEEKDDKIKILMTLTSPMCPYGPQLIEETKLKVKSIPQVKEVEIVLTFDPPWQPSDDLRAMLGV